MFSLIFLFSILKVVLSIDILLSRGQFTNSSPPLSDTTLTYDASKVVDGNTNGNFNAGSCFSTKPSGDKWLLLLLDNVYVITQIIIYPRTDCCLDNLDSLSLYASFDKYTTLPGTMTTFYNATHFQGPLGIGQIVKITTPRLVAKTLIIIKGNDKAIEICEFEIYGHPFVKSNAIFSTYNPESYSECPAITNYQTSSIIECVVSCQNKIECVSVTFNNGICSIFNHGGGNYHMINN